MSSMEGSDAGGFAGTRFRRERSSGVPGTGVERERPLRKRIAARLPHRLATVIRQRGQVGAGRSDGEAKGIQ